MKTFKTILEDILMSGSSGLRSEEPYTRIKTFKVEEMGKPVATVDNYQIYQIHHGRQTHRGHGKFIDINDPETPSSQRNWGTGGSFAVYHPQSGKFVAHMSYTVPNEDRPKELHIHDLHATEGFTGVRHAMFDTAADKLGYSLISDWQQTDKGRRSWENDIKRGTPISIRYYHDYKRGPDVAYDEVPVDAHNYKNYKIWSNNRYGDSFENPETGTKHDASDVLLVRHPKRYYTGKIEKYRP
jgi:hypothetical protein